MNQARFPNLFSEIDVGPVRLANRIVSTGHHTHLAHRYPNDRLIAYHEARARGGAGLIITEVTAVHGTAMFSNNLLMALDESCVLPFSRLANAIHRHGAKLFAQLFHPGREILSSVDGLIPVAFAPSAVPNERFHIMPRPMTAGLIEEVIAGYGSAARYLAEAGYDGVEVVASHGYLPAQFLNPRVNLRTDDFGGDFERRLRFVRQVISEIREQAVGIAVGLRLSGAEMDAEGLTEAEVLEAATAMAKDVDYLSVTAGTSASLGGSVHIVPPMGLEHAYVAPLGAAIKAVSCVPIIVTGRINQPQIAEQVIARGEADLCGMTRALICDPALGSKALAGRLDDIRACIACNQACIGRAHKDLGISCIQHPESGRELQFSDLPPVSRHKRIIVAGGGPAGMKAAAVAAARGHEVMLYEAARELGGQARLARRLPGREEFGGIIGNLEREMSLAGVSVVRGEKVTRDLVRAQRPDTVIVATGARPHVPKLEGLVGGHVVTAWDVLGDRVNVGPSVTIADWRADWIGLGLAERLARDGCAVTLCVNAAMAGETLQLYTRNHYVGRLHKLGVTVRCHSRLFGGDEETLFFQDTLSEEPIILENVDTLVLALGHEAQDSLERELAGLDLELLPIGDCVQPRTAEEAVFEGLQAGWKI